MVADAKEPRARERRFGELLEQAFASAGWTVERAAADFVARQSADSPWYVVEVKAGAEGRSDRLIPLWAQACLQASHRRGARRALAVVAAPKISSKAADAVLEFASKYAPDTAAGVIDFAGLRRFRGEGLETLNADPDAPRASVRVAVASHADLFSDLNQWLLKVLLAPELPEELLTAPRGRYRNASELAKAARVSASVAYRFTRQLVREGQMDESRRYLRLVRRQPLFERWLHSASRPGREMPSRVLIGDPRAEAARLAQNGEGCLGLFAAADALNLGFVHGVPPHVYVQRDPFAGGAARQNIVPAERHEAPTLILRERPPGSSVFRGMVERGGVWASDAIQVWLDVSLHPSRGSEQADAIRRRVLEPLISGPEEG
ncbi:MAG TPA: hypothetical protein VF647_21625 [Longimicrobium sp.]|jgi:hypothetical protein